tara:strand:- start:3032 stop:3691 length:660 start_codon:yes stop_codon:yes gene_type:complete
MSFTKSNDIDHDNTENYHTYLDTSWIQDETRLLNVENSLHCEPLDSIQGIFIYINQHNYIDNIFCETIPLTVNEKDSFISSSALIKLIQTNKISTPVSKYKFSNLFSFFVDIEPDSVLSFSKLDDDDEHITQSSSFKEQFITDSITIPPAIFVFHKINTLYFIYNETSTTKRNTTLKSILKSNNTLQNNHKTKKNVRITNKLFKINTDIKKNNTRKKRL